MKKSIIHLHPIIFVFCLLLSGGILAQTPTAAQIAAARAAQAQAANGNPPAATASAATQNTFSTPDELIMEPEMPPPVNEAPQEALLPYGANLFSGHFIKTRENGLNPNYIIMTGDKIAVSSWGVVNINNIFTVDGQGNIFLPEIGPIRVEGAHYANLNRLVSAAVRKVYLRNVNVYTNLLTANPIAVFVTGGVVNPGRYAGLPSDSVLYFLDQAAGINPNLGSYRRIVVLRDNEKIASIDLYDFLLNGKIDVPQLQDNDTILVERRGPVVELSGNVASPCLIEFKSDSNTGADAMAIIPKAATATEVTITGIRHGRPYAKTSKIDSFQQEPLFNGDAINIRTDGRTETIMIKLHGEFEGPTMLTVNRGARLVDVLNMVPTSRELANVNAVHILRRSVALAQKDAITDSLFRLERSALLALSASQGESAIRIREANLTAQFVQRARQIQPLGRVVTVQNGQQLNVLLEDGDTIVIPPKTNVVRIGGEVMIAQAVMFKEDTSAREYIRMAGGYSERGDDDMVIVLHADASVSIEDPDDGILPGDEILVPPRIDVKVLQNAADVMQIIYQVAVSAGVVLRL